MNDSKFKIGSIITAIDSNNTFYCNDIGIILDISDNQYKIHWFRYYNFGRIIINLPQGDVWTNSELEINYKVLK